MAGLLRGDRRNIFAVGASAGGVEALRLLVSALPSTFEGTLLVAMHLAPDAPSRLPEILDRVSMLPVVPAADAAPIEKGRIYVAVPDRHLVVVDGNMQLSQGPQVNRARPAVDVLFRSVARGYGPRAVGVVLTGNLDDGTAGLQSIKDNGGMAIVQDPAEALFPGMPRSAMNHVEVDHCVPLQEMASLLLRLSLEDVPDFTPTGERLPWEIAADAGESPMADSNAEMARFASPTAFVCPDCNGGLWEVNKPALLEFRCRVGHAYSPETLLAAKRDRLEGALWAAVQALEESASLNRRVVQSLPHASESEAGARLWKRAEIAMAHARRLRQILDDEPMPPQSEV